MLNVKNLFSQTQKRYFTEKEAKSIKSYLDYERDIVVYCLSNTIVKDLPRLIEIEKVECQKSEDYPDKYEISIKGMAIGIFEIENLMPIKYNPVAIPFDEIIDVAYIYVRNNGGQDKNGTRIWTALCLGTVLGFDVEPDIDPFDYPMPENRARKHD
jgi:hypothetical protein